MSRPFLASRGQMRLKLSKLLCLRDLVSPLYSQRDLFTKLGARIGSMNRCEKHCVDQQRSTCVSLKKTDCPATVPRRDDRILEWWQARLDDRSWSLTPPRTDPPHLCLRPDKDVPDDQLSTPSNGIASSRRFLSHKAHSSARKAQGLLTLSHDRKSLTHEDKEV